MSSFKIRSSKFRHVYGQESRRDSCFEGIRISSISDSNLCAVNPSFVAVITESAGGGSFIVLPANRFGRVDAHAPKVCGHKAPVIDVKWSPFNDNIIASSADDKTVKIWRIPDGGLVTNLTDWIVDLHGHSKRVDAIEWHPTASSILLSSASDYKCTVWNIEQAEPVSVIHSHRQQIYSIAWSRDGSLFSSTCKDRMIRVIDPRSMHVAIESKGHVGNRSFKVLFLGDSNRLLTSGFSRMSERQFIIWDMREMSKPLKCENMDTSNGLIMPFYDSDTKVVFLAGKGDGNIRYYELVNEAPFSHFLSEYHSSHPQKGMGFMPKRGLDTSRNEIMRFYKLHADKNLCEPISMIVPRRAETFQDDIYPPTNSRFPSLSPDQWTSGLNRDPILVSLKDGSIVGNPKTSTSQAIQQEDLQLPDEVTITTYRAVEAKKNSDERITQQRSFSAAEHSQKLSEKDDEPASIKNIRTLSSESKVANSISTTTVRSHPLSENSFISTVTSLSNSLNQTYLPELNGDVDHNHVETHISYSDALDLSVKYPEIHVNQPQNVRSADDNLYSPNSPDTLLHTTTTLEPNNTEHVSNDYVHKIKKTLQNNIQENDKPHTSYDDNTENVDVCPTYTLKKFKETTEMWNKRLESLTNSKVIRRCQSLRLPSEKSTQVRPTILDDGTFTLNPDIVPIENKELVDTKECHKKLLNRSKSFHSSKSRSVASFTLTSPVSIDPEHKIQVKKVLSKTNSDCDSMISNTMDESELKKAYLKQLDEIRSLRELISMKDKRIRNLEEELSVCQFPSQ